MPTAQERTVAVLKRARRLVEERWTKGAYIRSENGEAKCCALGAVGLATVAVERGEDELQATLKRIATAAYAAAAAYAATVAAAAADTAAADAAAADAAYAAAAYVADAYAAYAADADKKRSMAARQCADGYRVGPILRECVGGSVVSFNDDDETTKADVLKAFDCAIKKAEAAKGD